MNPHLFEQFNFNLINSPDFKEDSVREEIIMPILNKLGYNSDSIIRSKLLQHPFVKIGSQKRQINLIPDYVLKIHNNYAWVLDAKAPNEEIRTGSNIEQVFSYAIHPEIRTKYFALCNGKLFTLFRSDSEKAVFTIEIENINNEWEELEKYLSPDSFHFGKILKYEEPKEKIITSETHFNYLERPLLDEIEVKKQAAKRHFGITAYFTRQTWNVVKDYINNFTQLNDTVLDCYGGSGVTAIEAYILGRKAIHIDINPLSVFIVDSLLSPVSISQLTESFENVKQQFLKLVPKNKAQIKKALIKYKYPKGIKLPKGSDVENIEQLFSDTQLAELALLKYLILKEKEENIRKGLLLAFYNTISVCNLTFHDTPKGGGNHFGFYYRYRIAPEPSEQDVIKTFERKFRRVFDGKKEIAAIVKNDNIKNVKIYKGTATKLKEIKSESIDYIYTDPPYGSKIQYLDLSIIWNAWLDLEVTEKDQSLEAIEGGKLKKTKNDYGNLIAKSIEEMYRVLKFDRWMSFVFAHKDPEFWHLIVETAEKAGFEFAGATKQSNGQTSFKKRQNPFTVLSGQLIINFKKVKKPRAILKANLGMEIGEIVLQTIEGIIAKHNGATLEQINDELIIKGLELGFLDLLKKEYSDLTPILFESFDYDKNNQLFTLKKNEKFKTKIDIRLRIKYYLISYLRRVQIEKRTATFDEIVFHIMPLLKNGITPEHQTILNILEDIGDRIGEGEWVLKEVGQYNLF